MSESLSTYKKQDLVDVAHKVGVSVSKKDTKKVLIEKLEDFVEKNPEDAVARLEAALAEGVVDDATLVESIDDDEAEELEADEEHDEDELEEEEHDEDYTEPPVNLKAWVVDPIIGASESALRSVYEFTDCVGITATEYLDELRDRLLATVTLNYAEVAYEALYFLSVNVPLVALRHNNLVPALVKDNIPSCVAHWSTPDLLVLLHAPVYLAFLVWLLTALLLPLVASYYINFSRRVLLFADDEGVVSRIFTYDPFTFALSKVLLFYFTVRHGAVSLSAELGLFHAAHNWVLIQTALYSKFAENYLGLLPLVLGAANVLVAIYSQFEEY